VTGTTSAADAEAAADEAAVPAGDRRQGPARMGQRRLTYSFLSDTYITVLAYVFFLHRKKIVKFFWCLVLEKIEIKVIACFYENTY
jgi:hypothetical protein